MESPIDCLQLQSQRPKMLYYAFLTLEGENLVKTVVDFGCMWRVFNFTFLYFQSK